VHAPQTGEVVSVQRLSGGWYAGSYSGAVRMARMGEPAGPARRPLPRAAAAVRL
jgi:hypothetical protein